MMIYAIQSILTQCKNMCLSRSLLSILFPLIMLFFIIAGWKEKNAIQISTVSRTPTTAYNLYYPSNKPPLQPLHFIKLPVGSIQPKGWILQYLQLQKDGLTGQLGEISAWLEKENNAWFSGNGLGDHGWEEVPYWLKGYGDLAYILGDSLMIKEATSWIEKVLQSQRADGYFGPAFDAEKVAPDMWPNMIMLWCVQSYYEYSKDPRVLPFMLRYFKWQTKIPDDKMLETYWENSRGGDNLYSIYWLYNLTGESWLLDLANKIHRNTADWTQPNKLPNWHNVNVAQCFREPATYFMQTKDSSHLQASYNNFWWIRDKFGQVPGGMFGADENAREGFTDPRQAVETCGMVEEMSSDEMLVRITGDPFWADNTENVAFNSYPAAVMPDFKSLRYLTAPNMVLSDSKDHSPGVQNNGPFLNMNPFSSRCCQHNHAQGWPYYAQNLWMATPDNGLAAILYNSSVLHARAGNGNEVTLTTKTNYPFEEDIHITIHTAAANHFPVYVRIPGWCNGAELFINGKKMENELESGTYTRIEKTWNNNDVIVLKLPMKIHVTKWTKNKNSVSVNYGPLTFSLKINEDYKKINSVETAIKDSKWQKNVDVSKWPTYEIYPASLWNYGLILHKDTASSFTLIKKPFPQNNFPFTVAHVPLEIQATGKQIPYWGIDQYGLCDTLPISPVVVTTIQEEITLIPMGAARLRISAFPVVKTN